MTLDLEGEEQVRFTCISMTTPPYLVLLLKVGYHDNSGCVQLPDHAPEVREGGGDGTLGGYVPIGTLVCLDKDRTKG